MDKKNLIAVGVDRNGLLWNNHYGVSPQYYLFDFAGNLIEKRLNPYAAGDGDTKHHGKPGLIVSLLPECGVFIGQKMGSPEKLAEMGVKTFLTSESDPKAAIRDFLAGL